MLLPSNQELLSISAFAKYEHDEEVVQDYNRLIQNGHFVKGPPITQSLLHNHSRLQVTLSKWLKEL